MLVPGISETLIHHDNHNLKQATVVSTHILPNLSFKITVSSHLITCKSLKVINSFSVFSRSRDIFLIQRTVSYPQTFSWFHPVPPNRCWNCTLKHCVPVSFHIHTLHSQSNSHSTDTNPDLEVGSSGTVHKTASYCCTRPDLQIRIYPW
jgi:hypothetical protein